MIMVYINSIYVQGFGRTPVGYGYTIDQFRQGGYTVRIIDNDEYRIISGDDAADLIESGIVGGCSFVKGLYYQISCVTRLELAIADLCVLVEKEDNIYSPYENFFAETMGTDGKYFVRRTNSAEYKSVSIGNMIINHLVNWLNDEFFAISVMMPSGFYQKYTFKCDKNKVAKLILVYGSEDIRNV